MAEPAEPTSRRVLVTGGTGFIGTALVRALRARGDEVVVLSRDPARARARLGPGVPVVDDLARCADDSKIDAIVNLAGATILGVPWIRARRRRLLDSRLGPTKAVRQLCQRLHRRPAVLVSASAIGYYGVLGAEPVDETGPSQRLFQSQLCQEWEDAAQAVATLGPRVVCLRFGVVFGRDGGALPQLARPVRLGLGAVLGRGSQGAPWIHIDDAVRLTLLALDLQTLSGPVNAVAPDDVTHAELMSTLGQVLHRPIWLRVPAPLLRMALGEMSQLLVDGQHVVPARALAAGFEFAYPRLKPALEQLLGVHHG